MLIKNRQTGFTIVELLIVIVVIGILVAIVIVSYTGITSTATERAVESDLANFKKKMELYKTRYGSYPASDAQLDVADVKVTQDRYLIRNNFYYCRSDDGQHFTVGVYTITNVKYWLIDGAVKKTTDNVYGSTTCDQLDPHPHPVNVTAYGYHDDVTGWQAWTQ